jgi:hypothetical protein
MPKAESDIFIYKLKKADYWAQPSPYVARARGEIQFRNLTGDAIEIDMQDVPVNKRRLALRERPVDSAVVNDGAAPGVYEYVVTATVPPSRGSKQKPRKVAAKGGSSPRIIIDT